MLCIASIQISQHQHHHHHYSTTGALHVLRQPPETLPIPLPHNNTAHKHLDRPDTLTRHLTLPSSLIQIQSITKLILGNGLGVVNLVSENEEGDFAQLLHREKCVQLGPALGETLEVFSVDEEDDAADFRKIVFPEASRLLMAAEVEGGELAVADGELLGGGVKSGLEHSDTVVLQHVQQGCLSSIVKTEEEELCVLVGEAERGEDIPKPIDDPHGCVCWVG